MSPKGFLDKWGNRSFFNAMVHVMVQRDQEIDSLTGPDFVGHGLTHRRVKAMKADAIKAGLLAPDGHDLDMKARDVSSWDPVDQATLRVLSWAIHQEKAIHQAERRMLGILREECPRGSFRLNVSLSNMFLVDPTNVRDCQRVVDEFADQLRNPQQHALSQEMACHVGLQGVYSDLPEQNLFAESLEASWDAPYAGGTLCEGMPLNATTEFDDSQSTDEAVRCLMRLQWDCEIDLPVDPAFWAHLHSVDDLYNEMALQAWAMLSREDNPYHMISMTHPSLEDPTIDVPFLMLDMRDTNRAMGQATLSWEQTMTRILEHSLDGSGISSDFAP